MNGVISPEARATKRRFAPARLLVLFVAALLATVAASALWAKPKAKAKPIATNAGPRLKRELTGSLSTRDGQRLHLVTDLGNIHIHSGNSDKVDYRVLLETDASAAGAQELLKQFTLLARETPEGVLLRGDATGKQCSGRLWVTFEINAPKDYNLDVRTGGGNIETEDIDGHITLVTSGGNISAGSIGGATRLETGGGHITVKDVDGELTASTGGGHIIAGAVRGNATLRTAGGHIRVASIGGVARLDTGAGGNISVEKAGMELVAETRGGQIEVGEAAGLVHARTGGGGIRVIRSSGPTNLESGGGSIYLTQVNSAVRASTNAGGITAWLGNDAKSPGGCDLQSSDGDIVVYIPRQLPLTVDASIQLGDDHGLFIDPAFPIKVSYGDHSSGPHIVRAEGALNGGGEVLRLRTIAGNIRLVLSDANRQVQVYKQQMEQMERKVNELQMRLQEHDMSDGPSPDN